MLRMLDAPQLRHPLFYAAWRVGHAVIQAAAGVTDEAAAMMHTSAGQYASELVVGSLILAGVSSVLCFIALRLVWRWRVLRKWRRRSADRARRASRPDFMASKLDAERR